MGSSVLTSQTTIAAAINTGPYGADDYVAFRYVNSQFSRWGSGFRYVATNDTTSSSFQNRVTNEVDVYSEPLYVRVDVSSPYYVWHQGLYALHATTSVGYSNFGQTVMIADPYTASTSGCPQHIGYPGYSPTPDYGCIYCGYTTSSYYYAKSGTVYGELAEQY